MSSPASASALFEFHSPIVASETPAPSGEVTPSQTYQLSTMASEQDFTTTTGHTSHSVNGSVAAEDSNEPPLLSRSESASTTPPGSSAYPASELFAPTEYEIVDPLEQHLHMDPSQVSHALNTYADILGGDRGKPQSGTQSAYPTLTAPFWSTGSNPAGSSFFPPARSWSLDETHLGAGLLGNQNHVTNWNEASLTPHSSGMSVHRGRMMTTPGVEMTAFDFDDANYIMGRHDNHGLFSVPPPAPRSANSTLLHQYGVDREGHDQHDAHEHLWTGTSGDAAMTAASMMPPPGVSVDQRIQTAFAAPAGAPVGDVQQGGLELFTDSANSTPSAYPPLGPHRNASFRSLPPRRRSSTLFTPSSTSASTSPPTPGSSLSAMMPLPPSMMSPSVMPYPPGPGINTNMFHYPAVQQPLHQAYHPYASPISIHQPQRPSIARRPSAPVTSLSSGLSITPITSKTVYHPASAEFDMGRMPYDAAYLPPYDRPSNAGSGVNDGTGRVQDKTERTIRETKPLEDAKDQKPARFRPTKEQLEILIASYDHNKNPDAQTRERLARELGGDIRPKTLQIWFQNRRSKSRAKERDACLPKRLDIRAGPNGRNATPSGFGMTPSLEGAKPIDLTALRALMHDDDPNLTPIPITVLRISDWTRFLTPGVGVLNPDLGCALYAPPSSPISPHSSMGHFERGARLFLYVVHSGIFRISIPINLATMSNIQGHSNHSLNSEAMAMSFELAPGSLEFDSWQNDRNGTGWVGVGDFTNGEASSGGRCEITGERASLLPAFAKVEALLHSIPTPLATSFVPSSALSTGFGLQPGMSTWHFHDNATSALSHESNRSSGSEGSIVSAIPPPGEAAWPDLAPLTGLHILSLHSATSPTTPFTAQRSFDHHSQVTPTGGMGHTDVPGSSWTSTPEIGGQGRPLTASPVAALHSGDQDTVIDRGYGTSYDTARDMKTLGKLHLKQESVSSSLSDGSIDD